VSFNSDYDDAVQAALKLAETDPDLANAISTSANPNVLAYQLGRAHMQDTQKKAAEAQRIVENAQKPGAANAAATSAGSALNKVDFFQDMSDQDFLRHVAKVKAGLI
jgi:hypothetical protein